MPGLIAGPDVLALGHVLLERFPEFDCLVEDLISFQGQGGHAMQIRIVRRRAECATIAIQVIGLAVLDHRPANAGGKARHEIGGLLAQRGQQPVDEPKRLGHAAGPAELELEGAQVGGQIGPLQDIELPAQLVLHVGGLGGAKVRVDAETIGGGQAGGQALGVEPLPVFRPGHRLPRNRPAGRESARASP